MKKCWMTFLLESESGFYMWYFFVEFGNLFLYVIFIFIFYLYVKAFITQHGKAYIYEYIF